MSIPKNIQIYIFRPKTQETSPDETLRSSKGDNILKRFSTSDTHKVNANKNLKGKIAQQSSDSGKKNSIIFTIAKRMGIIRDSENKPKNESSLPFSLQEATREIGNYDLPTDKKNEKLLEQMQLDENVKNELLKGASTGEKGKRKKFLKELHKRLESGVVAQGGGTKKPTTLRELLGKDLLKLYKQAVAEESKSKEFILAVFSESTELRKSSPSPRRKMVMFVGGPSAAGKSFAQKALVDTVAKENRDLDTDEEEPDNFLVSVDGGVERELCQMRQMVLQAALSKGFTGIKDLHKHTKTGVKNKVLKASLRAGSNVHVVIPETFAALFKIRKFISNKVLRDAKAFRNIQYVFAEIRADQTGDQQSEADKRFQRTVGISGNIRAYVDPKKSYKQPIKMNNRSIGCESKDYQGKYFQRGIDRTKEAKEDFIDIAHRGFPNAMVVSVNSDNTHMTKDSNDDVWKEAEISDGSPDIKHISKREFDLWQKLTGAGLKEDRQKFLNNYLSLKENAYADRAKELLDGDTTFPLVNESPPDLDQFIEILEKFKIRSKPKIDILKLKPRYATY